MSASATKREVVREYLAALFVAKFDSATEVKKVYSYKRGKLDEGAPAILIPNGPITRAGRGSGGTRLYQSTMVFPVEVYVPEADIDAGWTESLIEDRLDLIEAGIAEVVADHRGPGENYDDPDVPWEHLRHVPNQPTAIFDGQKLGENLYVMEVIMLQAEVSD